MKNESLISAVDVGKYENIGVSWNQKDNICKDSFVDKFIDKLNIFKKGVIAIEAPLFIPSDEFTNLARSRNGKRNNGNGDYKIDQVDNMSRPWSISASFSCAIQFLSIFFTKLPSGTQIFTDCEGFINSRSGVFVCEAFISGGMPDLKGEDRKCYIEKYYKEHKINRHNHDAECAVNLLEKLFSETIKLEKILCPKYLNMPFLLSQVNNNLIFCGKPQCGIIAKSPKPCFLDKNIRDKQEIIEISFR